MERIQGPQGRSAAHSPLQSELAGTLEPPSVSPVLQSAELAGVQAKGDLAAATDVQATAHQGVSGDARSMPHLEAVQRSFGKHDISGVGAHVGGQAAEACEDIGAEAYATGNQVAFKSDPDLHTASHEAAHVVQQRSGVHLKGGVGRAGDRYEQHADAVADRVVQGKSAEDLLDGMAGGDATPDVQKTGEEQGAWLQQQTLAKDSFFDLIRQNLLAADSWKTKAEVVDDPPFWQTALLAVGGLVLNAALGGVGAALAGKLVDATAKFVTTAAINGAIEFGKAAAGKGVDAAIGAASGAADKKPLVAFCEQQKIGMSSASKQARETFVEKSGTHTDQKLTIAQMKQIKAANDEAFDKASEIQHHEMLVGWMGMNAGDTTQIENTDSNVQDIDNNGVLRLTVSGSGDRPVEIVSATVDGLNEGMRQDLSGSKVREWRKGAVGRDGKVRKQGIDLLITTGSPDSARNSYQVSNNTWDRITAAGQGPSSWTVSGLNKAVFFSFFAERTGNFRWVDSDMDWGNDYNWGADAGRWFLDNVRNAGDILAMIDNLTLPSVSG